jgi:neurotransmitter:Na+ symporter, NSS family
MSTQQMSGDSTWKSQAGYVWSLIGSAVGFANILSFSAHVYNNGGGAFLIPYCLALFALGIPLLILEGLIGHRTKLPIVGAFGKVWGKWGKPFGWLAVIACLSIGGFYVVLTGYSVAYTYFSATQAIPTDTKQFFLHSFLKASSGLTEFGEISIPILVSTLAVSIMVWIVLVRNVRDGIERICSVFMPLLAFIMTVFAVTMTCLPGGLDGWVYYLKPDFSKLADATLWRDVFGQLFFSLSLGLGIVVGYSRHTGQTTNISRAMLYVALGDFAVSFISGAAIFACLAHMSYIQQIPFGSILTSDSTFEIGFIVFPHMFKFFGPYLGQMIGVVFFFCIFIAGITGLFSIVESIAGNIEIEFSMTRKRAVTWAVVAMSLISLIFCMGNASHVIDALAPMVMGVNMLVSGLILIGAFYFCSRELREDAAWSATLLGRFFGLCVRYIAPVCLLIILAGSLWSEFHAFDLSTGIRWAWFVVAMAVAAKLASYQPKPQPQAI